MNLRGDLYILNVHEVVHRSVEAWERGATEVCLQGGIHPDFTGDFYVGVLEAITARLPEMHVHGFTPLEVWQGAHTLGVTVREPHPPARRRPGDAAGDGGGDPRRPRPGAPVPGQGPHRRVGGGDDHRPRARPARHHHDDDGPHRRGPLLGEIHLVLRQIQRRTGGFTEFVPLLFVHMGSLIFLQGKARPGPTWDEVVLVHAVGRIALDGLIDNIQASWVKLGLDGARLPRRRLQRPRRDADGREHHGASGAAHGQLATPEELEAAIRGAGRTPARRPRSTT